MLELFQLFERFKTNYQGLNGNLFGKILKNFRFLLISKENIDESGINEIENSLKIIFIDKIKPKYVKSTKEYNIICFDSTLLVIDKTDIYQINQFFKRNSISTIYFLNTSIKAEIENIFSHDKFKYSNDNINEIYQEEIENFQEYLKNESFRAPKFFKAIKHCISAFMIKKSYILSYNDRSDDYLNYYKSTEKVLNDFQYITLKTISELNSKVDLIYSIETDKLYVLKNKIFSDESYLITREQENYRNIQHPLFLQYYGCIEKNDQKYLLLEYINGKTLKNIEELDLSDEIKMDIIFQILVSFQYLHSKKYIYRDLKPANIMIDILNNVVIIDIDKMIKCEEDTALNYSRSFGDFFVAPEIVSSEFESISVKADIYSIGMIIYYIISNGDLHLDKHEKDVNISFKNFPSKHSKIIPIIKQCTNKNPDLRPNLDWIINEIYDNYLRKSIFYFNNENILKRILVIDAEKSQFISSYENILEIILFNEEEADEFIYNVVLYNTYCLYRNSYEKANEYSAELQAKMDAINGPPPQIDFDILCKLNSLIDDELAIQMIESIENTLSKIYENLET